MADLVATLGGRYSAEMGIDVDRGDAEVERWFLAATLFGTPISARIAERTYAVLAQAGVTVIPDTATRSWDELVALLDAGGYVRYDFRTATRLLALAQAVGQRYGGRIAALARRTDDASEIEAALDALPGWGPVTIRLFLRELRGIWPGARPAIDERAAWAAVHLGLMREGEQQPLGQLRSLAAEARVDIRDLESALVRLALAHSRRFRDCSGGSDCRCLRPAHRG